jgi:hypothetical protein
VGWVNRWFTAHRWARVAVWVIIVAGLLAALVIHFRLEAAIIPAALFGLLGVRRAGGPVAPRKSGAPRPPARAAHTEPPVRAVCVHPGRASGLCRNCPRR